MFPKCKKCLIRIAIIVGAIVAVLFLLVALTPFNNWISAPLVTRETAKPADAVIVLGGGLEKGCKVGKLVQERLLEGVALMQQGFSQTVVLTGGKVPKQPCYESIEMERYAESKGIPVSQIITEQQSTSTEENARFSKPLLVSKNIKTLLLVTSPFHTHRACGVFRKQGIAVTCIPADPVLGKGNLLDRLKLFKGIVREYGATVYYKLKGYI